MKKKATLSRKLYNAQLNLRKDLEKRVAFTETISFTCKNQKVVERQIKALRQIINSFSLERTNNEPLSISETRGLYEKVRELDNMYLNILDNMDSEYILYTEVLRQIKLGGVPRLKWQRALRDHRKHQAFLKNKKKEREAQKEKDKELLPRWWK